jgi:hypothetical protein
LFAAYLDHLFSPRIDGVPLCAEYLEEEKEQRNIPNHKYSNQIIQPKNHIQSSSISNSLSEYLQLPKFKYNLQIHVPTLNLMNHLLNQSLNTDSKAKKIRCKTDQDRNLSRDRNEAQIQTQIFNAPITYSLRPNSTYSENTTYKSVGQNSEDKIQIEITHDNSSSTRQQVNSEHTHNLKSNTKTNRIIKDKEEISPYSKSLIAKSKTKHKTKGKEAISPNFKLNINHRSIFDLPSALMDTGTIAEFTNLHECCPEEVAARQAPDPTANLHTDRLNLPSKWGASWPKFDGAPRHHENQQGKKAKNTASNTTYNNSNAPLLNKKNMSILHETHINYQKSHFQNIGS